MVHREDPPQTVRETPWFAVALLVLAALWCVLWFVHARGYWEDDAWIHLEFARSLAAGQGFSFDGHVVYGDTSPLWVYLLDAAHAFLPDWLQAGKALCVAGLLFALSGVFAYARTLVEGNARPLGPHKALLFAAAMVLLTVTGPYFGYWAYSGMEALSAAGLACWIGVLIAPQGMPSWRFLLAALAAGVAPLLRPEMSFFTLLVGLVLLARLPRVPLAPGRRAGLAAGALVLLATPVACWDSYALRTFGRIFPNTNAAKRADPHSSVISHLLGVYGFGFPLVLVGVLLAVAAYVISRRPNSREGHGSVPANLFALLHAGGWLPLVWTAVNSLFYVVNHTYVQTRYIFVTAPVVLIALMALAIKISGPFYRVALATGLVFGVAVSFLTTWPLVRNKEVTVRISAQLAQTVRALPPNAPVALFEIGEIAFLSEHPVVDTGGITRPGVIPYLADPDQTRLIVWMRGEGAQYFVNDHMPEPGAVPVWHGNYPDLGWHLNPRAYRTSRGVTLWKLPAKPAASGAP